MTMSRNRLSIRNEIGKVRWIMGISEELLCSQKHLIKKQGDSELVELTVDNVARAEAMIQIDSAYQKAADYRAAPITYPRKKTDEFKYGGSTAYWITQLKTILIDDNPQSTAGHTFEFVIENAVKTIDRENNTHLNADGQNGRYEISRRIIDNRENLIPWLCDPKGTDYAIVELIAEKTKGDKGRKNPSFASKFAHYACFYLFEGTECQDNFSIYDGILRNALPRYLEEYEIENTIIDGDYASYQNAIDELRERAAQLYGEKLSRNGLDHLLWYFHK